MVLVAPTVCVLPTIWGGDSDVPCAVYLRCLAWIIRALRRLLGLVHQGGRNELGGVCTSIYL